MKKFVVIQFSALLVFTIIALGVLLIEPDIDGRFTWLGVPVMLVVTVLNVYFLIRRNRASNESHPTIP